MPRKVTTSEFIRRASLIHGNKYCYDKVVYVNSYSNVDIHCNTCGLTFSQMTKVHLKGGGCKCQTKYTDKKSTEQFIEDVKTVHGDRYDYGLVEYDGIRELVKIICKIHGQFEQTARGHLSGHGCQRCARVARFKDATSVIQRAKEIHGDLYDYSLVEYKSSLLPIKIICSVHGVFEQIIHNHLRGGGCLKCCHEELSRERTWTTEQFIQVAKQKWDSFYDYSQTSYINTRALITVFCPEHGPFETKARVHLSGHTSCSGCQLKGYSHKAIRWLEKEASTKGIFIQHAENIGEFAIPGTLFHADGFHEESKTIYEYLGSFWHGDPRVYAPEFWNKLKGCTMGDLYDKTMKRVQQLIDLGYTVILRWEERDD